MPTSIFNKTLLFFLGFMAIFFFVRTAQANTYTVINTNDSGAGSLRQAIIDANGNPGLDTINLDPALSGGTINLLSNLPELGSIILDGTTTEDKVTIVGNPAFYGTVIFSSGSNNKIKGIAISGGTSCLVVGGTSTDIMIGDTGARDGNTMDNCTRGISMENTSHVTAYNNAIGKTVGNTSNGFNILGSSDITIGGAEANQRNIIVNNGEGLRIGNSTDITIQGNYIGTSTGSDDLGNTNWGILTEGNTANIVIGGAAAGEGNVISGNGSTGIANDGTSENTIIQGNYIGVTADGTAALANGGEGIRSSGDATIGGTEVGAGNLVSGNGLAGIRLQNDGHCTVQGNIVGLNAAGNAAIANGVEGIIVTSGNNLIGGTTADTRNIISGNTLDGLTIDGENGIENIIEGNYIGTNLAGTAAIPNARHGLYLIAGPTNNQIGVAGYGNVVSGNGGTGIRLDSDNTANNTIQGNIIGLGADGITPVGNAGDGLVFFNSHHSTVGSADDDTARNIIADNQHGILIDNSSNNTIVNNTIGLAADGRTTRINGQDGINIAQLSQLNAIGGTATNAGNTIYANGPNDCIYMNNATGNFNQFRANDCLSEGTSGNIDRFGTGNENIANPTVTAATATTSYVEGTAVASGDVDIYLNGLFTTSVTATVTGTWSKNMRIASGSRVSVAVTNANHSTSRTSTPLVTVADDRDSPNAATVTDPATGSTINATSVTLTGTKPAYTSVWINGVEKVANDEQTTWTVNLDLTEGVNTFVIVTKDLSDNSSSELTYTVTRAVDDEEDESFNVTVTARSNFQAVEGVVVFLTATVTNPDDHVLTYQWTQTAGPTTSITDGNSLRASITVPEAQAFNKSLKFCLTASEGANATTCTSDAILTIRIIPKDIDTEDYPGQSEYAPYNIRALLSAESRHAKQLSSAGLLVIETETQYGLNSYHTISFGNTRVLTASDEDIQVLVWGSLVIIGDPLYDSNRGIVAIIDSTVPSSRTIDLTKQSTQNTIDTILGNHKGDLFGRNLALHNAGADTTLLAVSAPGSTLGQLSLFDFDSLDEITISGSSTDKLKTPHVLSSDLNGDAVDEIILGTTNSSTLQTATSSYVGFTSPTIGIDLSQELPDLAFDTNAPMDLSSCGDLNDDGNEDCVFGASSTSALDVFYGNADLSTIDITDELSCDGDLKSIAIGDVTGDDIDDLVLGVSDNDDGTIYVVLGRTDLDTTSLSLDDAIMIPGSSGEGLGENILLADYNGNGQLNIISHLTNVESTTKIINLDSIVDENPGSWQGVTGSSSSGCSLQPQTSGELSFWWLSLFLLGWLKLRTRRVVV